MAKGTDSVPAGRRLLVTGAAGFVGSRVVEMLSAAGRSEIIATDVVQSQRAEHLATLPGVVFRAADLRDVSALGEMVEGCDAVIHLAAVRTKASIADPRVSHDVNVGSTYDLLAHARRFGTPRFVFGSSHTVYGTFQDPEAAPFREDDGVPLRGLNMYAACKVACESYLDAFANGGGPEFFALRFGTIYGPRVSPGSNGSILFDLLVALDRGERPQIAWSRSALHGLTYVDDVAKAVVAAAEADTAGRAVNVVGAPVSSEKLYSTLVRLYGADPDVIDWREEKTRYQRVSQDRMRAVLGFVPQTGLEQGLSAFIDWYRAESASAPSGHRSPARTPQ